MIEREQKEPPTTTAAGGLSIHLDRVIPWWVARPQSPPPFHPATANVAREQQRTNPRACRDDKITARRLLTERLARIMRISQASEGIPDGPESLRGIAKDWHFLV